MWVYEHPEVGEGVRVFMTLNLSVSVSVGEIAGKWTLRKEFP
jgi:hypothetical protein